MVIHSATVHAPPIPIPSTVPISRSSQTHPSILLSPITSSYNAPLYPPYLPRSLPQAGPSVFAGISSIPPYFGPSFPNTVSIPSQPLPPMTTLRTIPVPFSSTHPSILLSPITSSYNAPLYPPYLPRSLPQAGPSVFAGISSIPPYFGPSFPNTVSVPSQPLPPMTTLRTIPVPFSSILLTFLDLFPRQVPQYSLEFLPSLLTLDLHSLILFPYLLNPCLP